MNIILCLFGNERVRKKIIVAILNLIKNNNNKGKKKTGQCYSLVTI
jgi:hypothetical protein